MIKLTLAQKIENMTDQEVKAIWESFDHVEWNAMYDEEITMDEWGQIIDSEMSLRGIKKNW